ncbi:MAG: pyridoxamine 5'-phosphate oxidase family protein [Hamadaea sp.]|uniref:pyridoxamine 5'-phosphate oxidase family protein n=1 Tax=Hamadaea sp. TaxID=2024425 RepID=UPI0017CC8AB7|nr:pyridoxamine 5'-phosphate oxidase family protein [Hamadaea sp.]NUR73145.1 pyridoxamine 5'-phosphate oxidase family protein [Hamadaea sp.]NUT18489.1 pyridoxamine 5'-phosphate oxidase family protein [Hamadaea sp.]
MTQSAELIEITSPEELRELLGSPMPRAVAKERAALHPRDRDWLANSPFVLVATSDAEGNCDVSPKGDPAGFTYVIDDHTIAIPERKGNRRADGFHNILANPHVGLIYLIPGRTETLRINGRARLVSDAPFFDELIVKGHRPQLAVVVDIDTIFFHCAKAFLRSQLWKTETWNPDALPSHACLVKEVQPTQESLAELEEYYKPENYNKQLYAS